MTDRGRGQRSSGQGNVRSGGVTLFNISAFAFGPFSCQGGDTVYPPPPPPRGLKKMLLTKKIALLFRSISCARCCCMSIMSCACCSRAGDLAGNVSPVKTFTWTVDTNVPDTVRGVLHFMISYGPVEHGVNIRSGGPATVRSPDVRGSTTVRSESLGTSPSRKTRIVRGPLIVRGPTAVWSREVGNPPHCGGTPHCVSQFCHNPSACRGA